MAKKSIPKPAQPNRLYGLLPAPVQALLSSFPKFAPVILLGFGLALAVGYGVPAAYTAWKTYREHADTLVHISSLEPVVGKIGAYRAIVVNNSPNLQVFSGLKIEVVGVKPGDYDTAGRMTIPTVESVSIRLEPKPGGISVMLLSMQQIAPKTAEALNLHFSSTGPGPVTWDEYRLKFWLELPHNKTSAASEVFLVNAARTK
ncbi:hypothetical protein [Variovorax sp. HJSM1_2]|uniref:hypothetical protein n=1 Tax=Variovorax sp. HJSM1_2 TaxID=3366263 RepID=UPI003BC19C3A